MRLNRISVLFILVAVGVTLLSGGRIQRWVAEEGVMAQPVALSATSTILAMDGLDGNSTVCYILTKETREKNESGWIWEFRTLESGKVKSVFINHSQFMDKSLQKKLESLGIGYEKGMLGGGLAPSKSKSELLPVPGRKLLAFKVGSDGKATTIVTRPDGTIRRRGVNFVTAN